ncbi:DUF5060 domain-containing protein [Myxococcota bacterium]|nr:DUF5060 domain-containing protein [Myxococcota bacterium]
MPSIQPRPIALLTRTLRLFRSAPLLTRTLRLCETTLPPQPPNKQRLFTYTLRLCGLLSALFFLPACEQFPWTQQNQQNERFLRHQEGLQSYKEGRFIEAQRLFLDLQSKQPESRLLMFNLGAVYLQIAKQEKKAEARQPLLEKSEKMLKAALDKSSADIRQKAHYNLGLLYTEKKQYEEALFHFSSANQLARKILKQPDADAEKNQEILSMLLRQRKREQQKLSSSRVFRYEEKVFTLRAKQPTTDPHLHIALQGVFVHETTQTRVILSGYPTSEQQWQLRFVPVHSGKWRYTIQTIQQKRPDGSTTRLDTSLHDQGLFQVLPSARPGQLIVATDNPARFAWKKPEEAKDLTKKKKTAPSTNNPNPSASPNSPKPPTPNKDAASGKEADKKQPQIAKDERILVWRGLAVENLFSPTLQDKDFDAHLRLFEALQLNGILLSIDIDNLFVVSQGQVRPEQAAWQRLQKRLTEMQKNPIHTWAFVFNLRTRHAHSSAIWSAILSHTHARLAHTHAIWSLRDLPPSLQTQTHAWLVTHDPYAQPIAWPRFPKELLSKLIALHTPKAPTTRTSPQPNRTTSPLTQPSPQPNSTKDPKSPTQPRLRDVLHTHEQGEMAMMMRPQVMTPWLAELPIHEKLDPKAFLQTWWRRYLTGIHITLRFPRPLHKNEIDTLHTWLQKAATQEELPPHPDASTASATSKPTAQASTASATSKPTAQASTASATSKPTAQASTASAASKPTAQASTASATSKPVSQPVFAKGDLSRPFLHAHLLRMRWERFLATIDLHEYLRPDPISVRVPDYAALAKRPPQQINASSIPWRTVPMYGYVATNGLTTLYMPPPQRTEKPPKIQWKQYKLDLDFVWYNAQTGKFLETQKLRQVTGLEITHPKEEAHIAKVMIADHPAHTAYTVHLPHKPLHLESPTPLHLQAWEIVITPPKRPAFRVPFLRTSHGWEARFRPDQPGLWTFQIHHQNKPPQGDLGLISRLKVMPSPLPAAISPHPKAPRFLVAGEAPFFFYARREDALLTRPESLAAFKQRIQQIRQSDPALTVVITQLPSFAWSPASTDRALSQTAPSLSLKPRHRPTSAPTSTPPSPILASSPELLRQLDQIEAKIEILHKAGLHVALQIDRRRWSAWNPLERIQRAIYLIDRLHPIAPLLWVADLSGKDDTQKHRWFPQMLQTWTMLRLIDPQALQAYQKDPKKAQPPPLLAAPPLSLAYLGKPQSTARLEQAEKSFAMLWLETQALEREIRDFKLLERKRPIVLSWADLPKKADDLSPADPKSPNPPKISLRWAAFLWRSHLLGFHHTGPSLPTRWPESTPAPASPEQVPLAQRIPLLMRGFFQSFDWTQLQPAMHSLRLREHQAFGAETPAPRQAQQPHHAVVWVRDSVRGKLEFERLKDLSKHRYTWLDPIRGQQPIQPQLLPPAPKRGQPETFQLPFRPAVLYLFRRPPQKGDKKQQPQPQPSPKQDRVSQRQQIRNRLKRLQEDRRDLLRKMLQKQKPTSLSDKRG